MNFRRLGWRQIENSGTLRLLIFSIAVIFAWTYSTYDYNLYFDRAHHFDRALLLCLGGLILYHPAFVIPFLLVLHLIVFQFELPLRIYSWTDKLAPLQVLILFSAFLVLRVFRKVRVSVFIFMTLCLVGAHYFAAAQAKLLLGDKLFAWVLENRLDNLFVSSYINGWLIDSRII